MPWSTNKGCHPKSAQEKPLKFPVLVWQPVRYYNLKFIMLQQSISKKINQGTANMQHVNIFKNHFLTVSPDDKYNPFNLSSVAATILSVLCSNTAFLKTLARAFCILYTLVNSQNSKYLNLQSTMCTVGVQIQQINKYNLRHNKHQAY